MASELGYLAGFEIGTLVGGENWFFNSIVAALIVILAHTMVMMFSRAFKWEELERYSKSEILQGLATAVIVIFVVSIITQGEEYLAKAVINADGQTAKVKCEGVSIDATGEAKTMLGIVKCKVREKAVGLGKLYESVYSNAEGIFRDLSVYVSLLGFPVWQGNWDPETYSEAENIRILNQMITNLLIGLNGVLVLIEYISKNMLTVYLPAGILLRTFHFTRGIGAFFIAAAIGFYFVFPTLFILTDPTLEKIPTIPGIKKFADAPSCYPTFSGVATTFTSSGLSKTAAIKNTKQAAKVVSDFYISMTVHPFAVFAVTLAFVRYLMIVLSGEPYEIMRVVARTV
ncbi:hypothetical protein HYT84_02530 [Candidatus Micrarchaeota archaeon]|nr:hypothetical protein [Candidatus Micrarchaeota archaeon]